jgi:hypothetical protein
MGDFRYNLVYYPLFFPRAMNIQAVWHYEAYVHIGSLLNYRHDFVFIRVAYSHVCWFSYMHNVCIYDLHNE